MTKFNFNADDMPEQNDKSQTTVRMAFDFPSDLFSAWVRVMHWSLPQRDMQQILFAACHAAAAKQQSLDLLLKEAAKMTDTAILLE